MNKYLMMSAAVLIAGVPLGEANAATGLGPPIRANLYTFSSHGTYCDAFSVWAQTAPGGLHQYAAQHLYSGCYGTTAYNLPANGHQLLKNSGGGPSGWTGGPVLIKNSIGLADITFASLYGTPYSLEFQLGLPLGSKKSKWACWYSTNGVSALWCNNGHQAKVNGGGTQPHKLKESAVTKLASALKLRPLRQK